MVDEVIDYCKTRLLWNELLTEVKPVDPRQHARFEPSLRVLVPFEPELVKVHASSFLIGTTAEQVRNCGLGSRGPRNTMR